jgi:uncharacterized phage protein (TIGR02218 family)
MPKIIPAALAPTFQASLIKKAVCMRLTWARSPYTVFGFTTASNGFTFEGTLYVPAASFNPSAIASNANLSSEDLEVDGFINDESITEDDLRAGRWDSAAFEIFEVNWSDLTLGKKPMREGRLGKVTLNRQTFVAELLGRMKELDTAIGTITQPNCRNNLGDAKCKVPLGGSPSRTVSGTIDLCDTDFITLTDADRTEADVTFDEGVITFTSGQAAGLSFEIKAYIVGVMVTKLPVPYDVTGDSYTMTEGCIRSLTMCRDRFNNVVNFNGEPWLRGPDAAAQVGRKS